MEKLIYNTINNEGILRSSGPHRIIITNDDLNKKVSQRHTKFPPLIVEHVQSIEDNTLLKAKVFK